jgi:hypothetical protein
MTMSTLKGLTVDVLRSGKLLTPGTMKVDNFTNGGVTSRVNECVLVDPAIDEIFDATADRPALKIVRRNIGGRLYVHAEPIAPCPSNMIGYMFGGNFVTSSDSRINAICPYPIPVHDRVETQAQYDHLSR